MNDATFNAMTVTVIAGKSVSRESLAKAFDVVAPKANWKNQINAEVFFDNDFDLLCMHAAIEFFTAAKSEITPIRNIANGSIYRVKSPGYYATIGA